MDPDPDRNTVCGSDSAGSVINWTPGFGSVILNYGSRSFLFNKDLKIFQKRVLCFITFNDYHTTVHCSTTCFYSKINAPKSVQIESGSPCLASHRMKSLRINNTFSTDKSQSLPVQKSFVSKLELIVRIRNLVPVWDQWGSETLIGQLLKFISDICRHKMFTNLHAWPLKNPEDLVMKIRIT